MNRILVSLLPVSLLLLSSCNALLGYEMNHDFDAGSGDADTDVDTGLIKQCQKDTCNESLTAWLDFPESCQPTKTDCKCIPTENTCLASAPENECCTASCSGTIGCVTVVGQCEGSIDTCTDHILKIGKTCTGCGEERPMVYVVQEKRSNVAKRALRIVIRNHVEANSSIV